MSRKMAEFDFQVLCKDVDTSDLVFLDRLFEAGCDDATVSFKDGYICLDFTRESDSAENAVISAIKDFMRANTGGTVERVEPEDLASLSEIANRVGVTRSSLQKYARGESKVGKDFPHPVQNISASRRELFSTAEVINWMLQKNRVEIDERWFELVEVIAKTNQALTVTKAQFDEDVLRLVSQLSASEEVERKRA